MKHKNLLLLFSLLIILSCKKEKSVVPVPECIEIKVNEFKNGTCPTDAYVKQYSFQNKIVYAFSLGRCGGDLPTFIFDNDCNSLGSLGGVTGNTQINGVEFSTAVYLQTIWER